MVVLKQRTLLQLFILLLVANTLYFLWVYTPLYTGAGWASLNTTLYLNNNGLSAVIEFDTPTLVDVETDTPKVARYKVVHRKFTITYSDLLLHYSANFTTSADLEISKARVDEQCPPGTILFIFVPSSPTSFNDRARIRNTWALHMPTTTVLKFVIGNLDVEKPLRNLVMDELIRHGDLLLTDLNDTYRNLYLKVGYDLTEYITGTWGWQLFWRCHNQATVIFEVHAGLQWQQTYCPHVNYTLKVDDDVIVDVERLLHWIKHQFNRILGRHSGSAGFAAVLSNPVIRDPESKYYTSEAVYPSDSFPPYLNGPIYLLSGKAVRRILEVAPSHNGIPIEDVFFTGLLADEARVKRYHMPEHFRRSLTIHPAEACVGGVPLVVSICRPEEPKPTPVELRLAYTALREAKCDESEESKKSQSIRTQI